MILLWGLPGDSPLAKVRSVLCRRGAAVTFVDQREVLETEVEWCAGGVVQGVVRIQGRTIPLAEITAAYIRPYNSTQLSAVQRAGPFSAAWRHAVNLDNILMSWADLSSAYVVNRPAAMASNSAKPYQALYIQAAGFRVPATLVTTDPDAVRDFWAGHASVIYKSLSGVRSIVSQLEEGHKERLRLVRWCPTQFQQYIPGVDYRVHVVGDQVFACKISSQATDYRYAARQDLSVEICACELPSDIADRCRMLMESLGLSVAGIDFRRDPEGRWYCFEVNPSPAFTYYQNASGHPIDESIAELLMRSVA
jgi:hypothetical protein